MTDRSEIEEKRLMLLQELYQLEEERRKLDAEIQFVKNKLAGIPAMG